MSFGTEIGNSALSDEEILNKKISKIMDIKYKEQKEKLGIFRGLFFKKKDVKLTSQESEYIQTEKYLIYIKTSFKFKDINNLLEIAKEIQSKYKEGDYLYHCTSLIISQNLNIKLKTLAMIEVREPTFEITYLYSYLVKEGYPSSQITKFLSFRGNFMKLTYPNRIPPLDD